MAPAARVRPPRQDTVARFLTRARTRGIAEAAGSLWSQMRGTLRSRIEIVFFERPSGGEPGESEARAARATPGDAEAYARDIGTDSPATFQKRLTDTTHCWLLWDRGHIVHATWVTTSAAWTSELGLYFCPPRGSAYLYESYTPPSARGQGLYTFALRTIGAALKDERVAAMWIGVPSDNRPSLRAVAKAGFEERFSARAERRFGRITVAMPRAGDPLLRDDCETAR